MIRKFVFTMMFPAGNGAPKHIPGVKLHSLAKNQLADLEVIETINHLFKCQRCYETYRHVRTVYSKPWSSETRILK